MEESDEPEQPISLGRQEYRRRRRPSQPRVDKSQQTEMAEKKKAMAVVQPPAPKATHSIGNIPGSKDNYSGKEYESLRLSSQLQKTWVKRKHGQEMADKSFQTDTSVEEKVDVIFIDKALMLEEGPTGFGETPSELSQSVPEVEIPTNRPTSHLTDRSQQTSCTGDWNLMNICPKDKVDKEQQTYFSELEITIMSMPGSSLIKSKEETIPIAQEGSFVEIKGSLEIEVPSTENVSDVVMSFTEGEISGELQALPADEFPSVEPPADINTPLVQGTLSDEPYQQNPQVTEVAPSELPVEDLVPLSEEVLEKGQALATDTVLEEDSGRAESTIAEESTDEVQPPMSEETSKEVPAEVQLPIAKQAIEEDSEEIATVIDKEFTIDEVFEEDQPPLTEEVYEDKATEEVQLPSAEGAPEDVAPSEVLLPPPTDQAIVDDMTAEILSPPSEEAPAELLPPPTEETPAEVPLPPTEEGPAEVPPPVTEETPAGVLTPPTEENPAGVLTPPTEETPAGILTPPTEETPAGVLTPPTEETPAGVLTPPTEETPADVLTPPTEETPAEVPPPSTEEGPVPAEVSPPPAEESPAEVPTEVQPSQDKGSPAEVLPGEFPAEDASAEVQPPSLEKAHLEGLPLAEVVIPQAEELTLDDLSFAVESLTAEQDVAGGVPVEFQVLPDEEYPAREDTVEVQPSSLQGAPIEENPAEAQLPAAEAVPAEEASAVQILPLAPTDEAPAEVQILQIEETPIEEAPVEDKPLPVEEVFPKVVLEETSEGEVSSLLSEWAPAEEATAEAQLTSVEESPKKASVDVHPPPSEIPAEESPVVEQPSKTDVVPMQEFPVEEMPAENPLPPSEQTPVDQDLLKEQQLSQEADISEKELESATLTDDKKPEGTDSGTKEDQISTYKIEGTIKIELKNSTS